MDILKYKKNIVTLTKSGLRRFILTSKSKLSFMQIK